MECHQSTGDKCFFCDALYSTNRWIPNRTLSLRGREYNCTTWYREYWYSRLCTKNKNHKFPFHHCLSFVADIKHNLRHANHTFTIESTTNKMKQSILTIIWLAKVANMACTVAFTAHIPLVAEVSRPATRRLTLFMTDIAIPDNENFLSDEEASFINTLWNQSNQNTVALQDLLLQTLPTMSSKLIMKLKQSSSNQKPGSTDIVSRSTDGSPDEAILQVAMALQSLLDDKLSTGREVLATLLSAGELRKLDAEIGKASRAGKLDMAFFTVLDMNIKDAIMEETSTSTNENDDAAGAITGSDPAQTASRLSILKHVYTRCQEEVEKLVPPGVALLNKLLRTDQDSIRANQLQHYLCPQPNVIVLPDGQVIPVRDAERNKVLVPPTDLVKALATTVTQIRTVETAGGMSREVAANMVEACRNVAKEARLVIGKEYGVESQELKEFEEGLQPVFRPVSPESEFIQGLR